MKPVRHPSNTRELGAPVGWDQSGLPVEPLGITDTVIGGVPCVLSFWQPDAVDLVNIAAGRPIGLSIVGRTMPPAALVSFDPEPSGADLVPRHREDDAVDLFAAAMKAKLATQRAKGYGGWVAIPIERLQEGLVTHISKGDPVDVANFAMFLWARMARTTGSGQAEGMPLETGEGDAR